MRFTLDAPGDPSVNVSGDLVHIDWPEFEFYSVEDQKRAMATLCVMLADTIGDEHTRVIQYREDDYPMTLMRTQEAREILKA